MYMGTTMGDLSSNGAVALPCAHNATWQATPLHTCSPSHAQLLMYNTPTSTRGVVWLKSRLPQAHLATKFLVCFISHTLLALAAPAAVP